LNLDTQVTSCSSFHAVPITLLDRLITKGQLNIKSNLQLIVEIES
jgi:hypothetical protein